MVEKVRNYKTVTLGGCTHVSANGVVSLTFTKQNTKGEWVIKVPRAAYIAETMEEAVELIANAMDTWYTIAEAAEYLVEMGAFDSPPSAQMMGTWCRAGRFPDAAKVRGKGCRGGGGSWRISLTGLETFVAERSSQ